MKKFIKQLLTGVVALGLLASVATSSINSVQTTVQAKSRWHYGVPRVIKGKWRSSLVRTNQYYHHGYMRTLVNVGRNKYGFNPFPYWYNSRKHFKMSGATNGEFWHPHYRYLGHSKYEITSGDHFNGRSYSMKYIIKKHSHNRMSTWTWDSDNDHMIYDGYFTKARSNRQWLRK